MTHFNQRSCPVMRAPKQETIHAESSSDVAFACGALAPEGTSSAASAEEPVEVFQQEGAIAAAKQATSASLPSVSGNMVSLIDVRSVACNASPCTLQDTRANSTVGFNRRMRK